MKTKNLFMVSVIAILMAGAARADIASTKYVDDKVSPVSAKADTNAGNITSLQTGKQDKITSTAKLNADLVDDSSSENKFVTASEKTAWSGKQAALSGTSGQIVTYGATAGAVGSMSVHTASNPNVDATENATVPTVAYARELVASAAGDYVGSTQSEANKALITDGTGEVQTGQIATGMIANGAVTTALIADENVTLGKLASGVQTSLGKADTALQSHQTIATGSANGTISVAGSDVAVKGLGSAAYTASTDYATAAQGTLAASALQKADIDTGTTNGKIKVADKEVSVYGLGSAAYTASGDYAPSMPVAVSPTTDGQYVLTAKVVSGTVTYGWESIGRVAE